MVDIITVFWIFIIFFAFLGFVRGWAREILVAASVILAFFVIYVIETYVPVVAQFFANFPVIEGATIPIQQFWFRTIMVVVLVFFGYETPSIPRLAGPRFKRDNFRDSALGFILGGFNGYLGIRPPSATGCWLSAQTGMLAPLARCHRLGTPSSASGFRARGWLQKSMPSGLAVSSRLPTWSGVDYQASRRDPEDLLEARYDSVQRVDALPARPSARLRYQPTRF